MAVINRTERCLVGKMCHNVQGIVLFFAIVCCGLTAITATEPRRSCDLVKKDVEQILKVQTPKVLDRPQTGVLCGESCCTRELEKEAYKHNQQSVHKYIRSSILKVSSIISNRARKFDELFRAMMNNSKREFHEMFERTYGKIYLKNSDVFSDFLGELETYYKKGTIRLSETMDTFFGILYQRMFTVINAQYTFDERYLECVSDHMAEMKPFGDVPHKLGIQLRRSFVATRTFYKSLIKGAEAANRLAELNVDDECYKESTKMRFCGLCKGEANGKPCSSYCTSTMRECFMYHMQFSTFWDNFVDAIDKVGDRLLGPYNIEIVVEPLNIKISEAIMNFQESGADVSKKIYNKCGKPMFSRPKRKADYKNASEENPNTEIKIKPMKGHGKKRKHKKVMEGPDMKSTLEKIIIDIKQKIKETKQFWLNLPHQFCNTLSITPTNDTELCRNATTPMYDRPQTKSLDAGNSILDEQTYILQGLTDKLRKAHQGQEVEIVDDTEEALAGGSEGSGSGSGDGGDMEIEETGRSGIKDIIFNENPDESVPEEAVPTVPATTSSTQTPEVVRASGTSNANDMSLTRALIQYLLPMVLVWFGGAISNLL